MTWKTGDWVIFELSIGQIKRLDEEGFSEFSDGSFATSGRLEDRFRPLTLRNKRTIEYFDYYYGKLNEINGEAGFNYPDIFRYFAQLSVDAIDGDEKDQRPYERAREFLQGAKEYKPTIDGVQLFRQNRKVVQG